MANTSGAVDLAPRQVYVNERLTINMDRVAAMPIKSRPELFFPIDEKSPNGGKGSTFFRIYDQAAKNNVQLLVIQPWDPDAAASYLPELNLLLIPTTLFSSGSRRDRREAWVTTAHELHHAVRWQSLLWPKSNLLDRLKELDRRALAVSVKDFVHTEWEGERAAELFGWRCYGQRIGADPKDIEAYAQERVRRFTSAYYATYIDDIQQSWLRAKRRTYQVMPGDWLSKIAVARYQDMFLWPLIFENNRDVIGNDPNKIKPGQIITVLGLEYFAPEQIAEAKKRGQDWKPSK